ncbi:GNAT family N-acetyltransferase [Mesorhizobium sp. M0678]|uniref:GNAT family N-acetyltransferase n=1 Tax=Mesorhizobium sp. M0678 TaxID=2956985 RepID=UPI0033351EA8
MSHFQFVIKHDAKALTPLLSAIQALADSEKDALGFLPGRAFEEAIGRQRLIAALVEDSGVRTFAGYLLHGGVFPNAKIQQIAAVPAFRKNGAASALMKAFVSELERLGFLSLRADVASNLPAALAFYAKNGFERVRERSGGLARGRTIIIHSRQLETDNLFTLASAQSGTGIDLGVRRRGPGEVPVFAFDLNVYFDLVRQRHQSDHARRLFGEALGHTIRLAVADEFVAELRKTSNSTSADPVLQMALQLPRLPKPDASELETLAARIYDTVFEKPKSKGVGTDQARSDANHVAHAMISRASAFITRDGPILNARNELLATFGIDIATVEEVLDLLPPEPLTSNSMSVRGEGFEPGSINASQLSAYLLEVKAPSTLASEFADPQSPSACVRRWAIRCDDRVVGAGVVLLPRGIEPIARMFVQVRHEHQGAELFADYLLDTLIRDSCESAPVTVELVHLSGQSIVNKLATARGFQRTANASTFSKIAVGRPLTADTWSTVTQQVRRRTGLVLPDTASTLSNGEIKIRARTGASKWISAAALEDLLGPTIFVWPGCGGVIVPITRAYADELLGTAVQATLGFVANRDAAFLSTRGYINAPRTVRQMRAGMPIVFYESKRKGNGRGAAVAVARIVNSILIAKSQLNSKSDKRLVIDSVESFSATDDVLLTTFDNLMAFPSPVGFETLKKLDAVGGANLVSAVSLSSEQITFILTCGWPGGKIK